MIKDLGQPRGFSIFFLTEMWERYGFYVIQTLLVFYLLKQLHMIDSKAYVIVGSFTALSYINSIFGGLIADKILGYVNTINIGTVVLILGYSILGISASLYEFVIGLSIVSVGTGFLKPNISSMLSIIYEKDDIHKESGYTVYYVGIYIGAITGSFLGGYINQYFGWSTVFFSSSLGLFLALLIFNIGKLKYNLVDRRKNQVSIYDYALCLGIVLLLILISFFVINSELLSLFYFIFVGVFCLSYILHCIITHKGKQRSKLTAFLFLFLFAIVYWGLFFQQFFSISLCTGRICHLSMPASSMSAIESLGVIIFGPIINYIWLYLKQKQQDLSIPAKFSLGFLFNSISFFLLSFGIWYSISYNIFLPNIFIIIAYLLIAVGELCLSPTSLSMVSSLVPEHLRGAMMGVSLLSIGLGGKLAGLLAADSAINAKTVSLKQIQHIYLNSFFSYFIISLITFIFSVILIKYIRKLV